MRTVRGVAAAVIAFALVDAPTSAAADGEPAVGEPVVTAAEEPALGPEEPSGPDATLDTADDAAVSVVDQPEKPQKSERNDTTVETADDSGASSGLGRDRGSLLAADPPPANPVAGDDEYWLHAGDRELVIPAPGVLANDSPSVGNPNPTGRTFQVEDPGTRDVAIRPGTFVLGADGSLTYRLKPDFVFSGPVDDYTSYRVIDRHWLSGWAQIRVHIVNAAPTAVADHFTLTHDHGLTVGAPGLLANDTDADGDMLRVGLVNISGLQHGQLTANGPDGSFTYTPHAGFVGTDAFTYRASDGNQESATTTVTIDVVNHAPVAALDMFHVAPGEPIDISAAQLLTNDTDADADPLAIVDTLTNAVQHGSIVVYPDGSVRYTADPGFTGTDGFLYRVSDGVDTDIAPVVIKVSEPPVLRGDHYQVHAGQTLHVPGPGVSANDTFPDPDEILFTADILDWPSHFDPAVGMIWVGDGGFDYTPEPGFVGTDAFTYRAVYKGFSRYTEPVTVTIDVLGPDQPPAVVDDQAGTGGGGLGDGTTAASPGRVEGELPGTGGAPWWPLMLGALSVAGGYVICRRGAVGRRCLDPRRVLPRSG